MKSNNWNLGNTPIEVAAIVGQLCIVKILVPEMDEPMKMNTKGWGLIHYAANDISL